MFKLNDTCYVKTSKGYRKCLIKKKQGSYYIVKTDSAVFGASEHRLITSNEYEELSKSVRANTFHRPPLLH